MTTDEFNDKYAEFLAPRFDGMEFSDEKVIEICNNYFKHWVKIPGFQYYQIKRKFNTSRVYCDNVDTDILEKEIDDLIKINRNK